MRLLHDDAKMAQSGGHFMKEYDVTRNINVVVVFHGKAPHPYHTQPEIRRVAPATVPAPAGHARAAPDTRATGACMHWPQSAGLHSS
jgi:hypothetical protein